MECEVCGQESEDAFEVVRHVGRHRFDTFECVIYALAPRCAQCGVRIIGHPVKEDDHTFCCAHCAEAGPSERFAGSGENEDAEEEEEDGDAEDGGDQDDGAEEEEEDDGAEDEEDEEDGENGEEGDAEGEGDDQLDRLDERISSARQSADDLLTDPSEEVDQEEAEVEPESEVGGRDGDGDEKES